MDDLRAIWRRDKVWTTAESEKLMEWFRMENMPDELKTAELVMAEEMFYTQKPIPLSLKPDQIYLTKDNWLVPVDTKTRYHREVTMKDIIQISYYKMGMRYTWEKRFSDNKGKKHKIAPYGYIRLAKESCRPIYVKVKLLSDDQLMDIWLATILEEKMVGV